MVYPLPGFMRWDTCAVEAVVRTCGGLLTDVHGNDYAYDAAAATATGGGSGTERDYNNTGGVVATLSRERHAAILSKIPASCLQQVLSTYRTQEGLFAAESVMKRKQLKLFQT